MTDRPLPADVHAALVAHLRAHSVKEGDFVLKLSLIHI